MVNDFPLPVWPYLWLRNRKVRADKIARARDVRENSTVEAIHCFLHKRCDLHLVQLWRGGGILQQLI